MCTLARLNKRLKHLLFHTLLQQEVNFFEENKPGEKDAVNTGHVCYYVSGLQLFTGSRNHIFSRKYTTWPKVSRHTDMSPIGDCLTSHSKTMDIDLLL